MTSKDYNSFQLKRKRLNGLINPSMSESFEGRNPIIFKNLNLKYYTHIHLYPIKLHTSYKS